MASGSGRKCVLKFPLFFNNSLTKDDADRRFNLLEEYCDKKNKARASLTLLWKGVSNMYAAGISPEMVAKKYRDLDANNLVGGSSSNYDSLAPVLVHPIDEFGLGVFAEKGIQKGDYIMDYPGYVHRSEDLSHNNQRYAVDLTLSPSRTPTGFALDASEVGGVGRFLNHSCQPNVEAHPKLIDGRVRIVIEAARDIPPHEQLCWSYGREYFEKRRMACFCGTPVCQIKPRTRKEKEQMEEYHNCIENMWRSLPRIPAVPYPRIPASFKMPRVQAKAVQPGPSSSSSPQQATKPKRKRTEEGTPNPSGAVMVIPASTPTSSTPPPGQVPSTSEDAVSFTVPQVQAQAVQPAPSSSSSSQQGTQRKSADEGTPTPSGAVMVIPTSTPISSTPPPAQVPSTVDAAWTEQAWQSRSREILKLMYDDGIIHPDIKLETRDSIVIDAHASVLGLGSPVFHNLVEKLKNENNGHGGSIKLTQINALPLKVILHWMYRDELIPSVSKDLDGVIKAATYLKMKELVGILEQRLISEYSLDNMGKLYLIAKEFRNEMPEAFRKISEMVQRDLGVKFASQ